MRAAPPEPAPGCFAPRHSAESRRMRRRRRSSLLPKARCRLRSVTGAWPALDLSQPIRPHEVHRPKIGASTGLTGNVRGFSVRMAVELRSVGLDDHGVERTSAL